MYPFQNRVQDFQLLHSLYKLKILIDTILVFLLLYLYQIINMIYNKLLIENGVTSKLATESMRTIITAATRIFLSTNL